MANIDNPSGNWLRRFKNAKFSPLEYLLAFFVLVYLALEMHYLYARHGSHFTDLTLYYGAASKILDGQVPYRDFQIEYPILALIPVIIPEFLNRIFTGTLNGYIFWFAAQNITLGLAAGYLVAEIEKNNHKIIAYRYLGVLLLSLPIFLFRFDPFPSFLTALTLYYLAGNPFISASAMMISIATKLYALVMIPVLGLYYLFNRQFKKLFIHAAGFTFILLLIVITFFWIGNNAIDDFLSNHLLRGIHLESVAGGILLLFQKAGILDIQIIHNYGAFHLESAWSDYALQIVKFLTPVAFIAMLCFIIWVFLRETKRSGHVKIKTLIQALLLQTLLFILLNKVFSPQYLVSLLPLIPFCNKKSYLLFAFALMLTVIIFPGQYYGLIEMKLLMIVILNFRNFLLVWLLAEVVRDVTPNPLGGG
ncbi:hypothetical protein [Dyadobacter sp. CY343]|uniref:hypothetical protein n=1 Tax=Dyadobacter sp. CY343 TaxID=2907299 RepID=UPI001F2AA931|nr:hypothetical protein [Dyadobacter sp. CY343]MCE7060247.1 hypothetical protein [Dyadobacter sp. CY343]